MWLTGAEFTPHQRDVFCVFSGNMVSSFRQHLNTDAQFEELRESYPGAHRRLRQSRRTQTTNEMLADPYAVDDEMGDEDNEYDAFDASQLAPDVQAQNQVAMPDADGQPQSHQTIPPPPPLHNQMHAAPDAPHLPAQHYFHDAHQMGPLGFSSFLNNQPAQGQPPLSAHGYAQASMAPVGASGHNPNAAHVNGASTASMHHRPSSQDDGDDDELPTQLH